jgi:hypothetical protein
MRSPVAADTFRMAGLGVGSSVGLGVGSTDGLGVASTDRLGGGEADGLGAAAVEQATRASTPTRTRAVIVRMALDLLDDGGPPVAHRGETLMDKTSREPGCFAGHVV